MKKTKQLHRKTKKREWGDSRADSLFVMRQDMDRVWFEKTAELAKTIEEKTGKKPVVVFSMFHGMRGKEARAWTVTDWHLEDWKPVVDSVGKGFAPLGHITLIPDEANEGAWITDIHFALPDWKKEMSKETIDARIQQALDLVGKGRVAASAMMFLSHAQEIIESYEKRKDKTPVCVLALIQPDQSPRSFIVNDWDLASWERMLADSDLASCKPCGFILLNTTDQVPEGVNIGKGMTAFNTETYFFDEKPESEKAAFVQAVLDSQHKNRAEINRSNQRYTPKAKATT